MKNYLIGLLIFFIMFLRGTTEVAAQNVLTNEEMSWLEESNQIKYIIGYPSSITPLAYSYFSSSSKGVINDISQEFNRLTDLSLFPISVTDSEQNKDIIDFGIVDLVVTGKKDEYDGMYYSNPIHEFEYSFFVKSDSQFKVTEDMIGRRVGFVDNDDLIFEYLKGYNQARGYSNYIKLYNALENGEIDCIFVPSDMFMYQSESNDLREIKFPDYRESAWYFMSDEAELISILNKIMTSMQTIEEYADSFMKHENALNSKLYNVDKQTYEWLFYSKQTLKIGIYDVAPFMYYNKEVDGLGGLLSSVLKQIQVNFGVEFDFIYGEYEELLQDYMDNKLDILPVFNNDLNGESLYTVYQGQINAYGDLEQSMLQDEMLQEEDTKLGSLMPLVISFDEILDTNVIVSKTIVNMIEQLIKEEISYIMIDPIFLDYIEQYDVYQKGKLGKYSFSLMVKDVDYNVKFFDAIKERDFQGDANADRYSTLLGTEMYLYEMSQLKENLYSMQKERLALIMVFGVAASALVILYRQRYLDRKTEYLKYTDYATGLLNRLGYQKQIEKVLNKRQKFAFIIFDIDYFKSINDKYGHLVGDAVIVHVANVLKSCCGKKDILCRLGGDEFIACVMMDDVDEVCELIGKIQEEMMQYVPVHGESFKVTSSIGVTFYDGGARDIEEIYHDADQALYKSKRNGRNQFNIF